MANPSKAKGTRAETRVTRYLVSNGIKAERKALAGSSDQGDLRLIMPDGKEVAVEVKTGKQTDNYSRGKLSLWKYQTKVEGENSGCDAILVIVRYRRSLLDAEVWIPNGDGTWTMMYLDEYIDRIGG